MSAANPGARWRILGIDPGLQRTGWGMIEQRGQQLSFVACGTLTSRASDDLATRLAALSAALSALIATHQPDSAAIEETFVSVNGASTLKLGQARGALLLTLAQAQLSVAEYSATHIKKAVVGSGRAEKSQIAQMVQMLLPGAQIAGPDAADALAVAITHAHHGTLSRAITQAAG